MPQKLDTNIQNVENDTIINSTNKRTIFEYYRHLISRETSSNYQKDNVKLIHMFTKFLKVTFEGKKRKETIISFLDTEQRG